MPLGWSNKRLERPKVSLADQVYSEIREAIFSLNIIPGSPLVESEISRAMGTSPTPVREALRRLQSEGLVTASYARHVYVRGLSITDIKNIYEVRAQLEPWAVRKCVPVYDENDFGILEQNIKDAEYALENSDLISFTLKNAEFHHELCKKCGNEYLLSVLDNIAEQQRRIRIAIAKHLVSLTIERSDGALEEHWRIFQAIQKRDVEKAVVLVYEDICDLLGYIEKGKLDSLNLVLNPQTQKE